MFCNDHDSLYFIFITCSDYFRLSMYTWGILLTYIRHRLSSRLRFYVFWEAGCDREESFSSLLTVKAGFFTLLFLKLPQIK